jgi:hypothetical protein
VLMKGRESQRKLCDKTGIREGRVARGQGLGSLLALEMFANNNNY